MADPVIKKIDTLADLEGIAAANDKMVVIDVSDTNPVTKTKLVKMEQISLHLPGQLAANIVETLQIKDHVVTEAKLGEIKRTVVIRVTAPEEEVEIFNYSKFFPWPVSLNSFVVVDARINLATAASGDVTVVLSNQSGTMCTLSLNSGQTGMGSSGVISESYRTAITNNFLGVNVTAAGAGAKGLTITLVLQGVPS